MRRVIVPSILACLVSCSRMDRIANDAPFRVDNIPVEHLIDNDLPNLDVPVGVTFNFSDPMDPAVCCEEPKECMCQFGCVDQNYTCPVDVVLVVDLCHCDNKRWINTIEFVIHL